MPSPLRWESAQVSVQRDAMLAMTVRLTEPRDELWAIAFRALLERRSDLLASRVVVAPESLSVIDLGGEDANEIRDYLHRRIEEADKYAKQVEQAQQGWTSNFRALAES